MWEPTGLAILEAAVGRDAARSARPLRAFSPCVTDGRRQQVSLSHPLYGEILRATMPGLTRRRLLLDHGRPDRSPRRSSPRRTRSAWRPRAARGDRHRGPRSPSQGGPVGALRPRLHPGRAARPGRGARGSHARGGAAARRGAPRARRVRRGGAGATSGGGGGRRRRRPPGAASSSSAHPQLDVGSVEAHRSSGAQPCCPRSAERSSVAQRAHAERGDVAHLLRTSPRHPLGARVR